MNKENNNNIINNLYIIVSNNYETSSDIIKIKDILVDNKLGEVDMKTSRSLSIKVDNIDKNIIINFPHDCHSTRSFTIGYEKEENDKNKENKDIDKKYLDEICYATKRNDIRKILTIGGKIEKLPDKKTDGVEEPKDEDNDKKTEKEHFDEMWKLIVKRSCRTSFSCKS